MEALKCLGFTHDSSYFEHSVPKYLMTGPANEPHYSNGLIEVPVSAYLRTDKEGNVTKRTKLDINWSSPSEMLKHIENEQQIYCFMMHSFSFLFKDVSRKELNEKDYVKVSEGKNGRRFVGVKGVNTVLMRKFEGFLDSLVNNTELKIISMSEVLG